MVTAPTFDELRSLLRSARPALFLRSDTVPARNSGPHYSNLGKIDCAPQTPFYQDEIETFTARKRLEIVSEINRMLEEKEQRLTQARKTESHAA